MLGMLGMMGMMGMLGMLRMLGMLGMLGIACVSQGSPFAETLSWECVFLLILTTGRDRVGN